MDLNANTEYINLYLLHAGEDQTSMYNFVNLGNFFFSG